MESAAIDLPLCIDLDGTLLKSDLLLESCLALLVQHPSAVLRIPAWLMRGKAYFKEQIATRVNMARQ